MRSKGVISSAVLLGAVVVVCAVVLVTTGRVHVPGFGGDDSQASSDTRTIRGVVDLTGSAFGAPDGQCGSTAGYDDITAGAPVVIHNASGKTVAVGNLRPGTPAELFDDGAGEKIPAVCEFAFMVADVPTEDFYGVAVGHRNTVTFTRAQVEAGQVKLTLGS